MRHRLFHPLTALVVTLLATPGVAGQAATQRGVAPSRTAVASPAAPGLDPVRAARIDAVIQRYVAEKKIAGVVALVARHGRIAHLEAYGRLDSSGTRR